MVDFLHPLVIVGGITAFGAAGLFYNSYFGLTGYILAVCSVLSAVVLSILVYFLHIKRMKHLENSIAHSIQDLVGKIGVVSVPIPTEGLGEIIVKTTFGVYNYSANSFDNIEIKQGTRVVVVQVDGFNCAVSIIDI
jgi:membrane protein implicated in regulation of membrane protease activity